MGKGKANIWGRVRGEGLYINKIWGEGNRLSIRGQNKRVAIKGILENQ